MRFKEKLPLDTLSDVLKNYDPDLFAERDFKTSLVTVYRRTRRPERYFYKGCSLIFLREHNDPILHLTTNWHKSGEIAHWGALNVLARLQKMDSWRRESLFKELEEKERAFQESRQRKFRGDLEDRVWDGRRAFLEATKHVYTKDVT